MKENGLVESPNPENAGLEAAADANTLGVGGELGLNTVLLVADGAA